jgi:uncharacterized protein YndB with AHSA1/START domain
MATPSLAPETSLQIKRTFAAPQQTLFDAWTKPERMKKWFLVGSKNHETNIQEVDLRVGGKIRAEAVNKAEGKSFRLLAVFKEIVPIEKLVYSWTWEEGMPGCGESLVTVQFRQLGESNFTEVTLTHERFPNSQVRYNHNKGWNGCFDMLAASLSA